jgi:hypothetical protein
MPVAMLDPVTNESPMIEMNMPDDYPWLMEDLDLLNSGWKMNQ